MFTEFVDYKVDTLPYYFDNNRPTDVSLADDTHTHTQEWAVRNGMIIIWIRPKIVLHRPHHRKWSLPHSIESIKQVQWAKLLGVVFQSNFSFVEHVDSVLTISVFVKANTGLGATK